MRKKESIELKNFGNQFGLLMNLSYALKGKEKIQFGSIKIVKKMKKNI